MSRSSKKQRRTECVDCGHTRWHSGRGLCGSCWHRHDRNGTLENFPRVTRDRAEILEDWAFLSREGYTRAEAARRMGITKKCLEKAIERARRAGEQVAA